MARIYDVVCCNCGEVMQWCKYDPPIEYCERCETILAYHDRWTSEAKIFGCGSCSTDVDNFAKPLKEQYDKRYENAFQNPSFRIGRV
jgi:hypothetical protein